MTDSIVINNDHQSMSTDSEESFLIKQLNKSSHFNSSSSNSVGQTDSSVSDSRNSYYDESQSFMRRSSFFLNTSNDDSSGPQRSFTILRDTIDEEMNESHEETFNLTGLSVLNADVLHGNQALGEINLNISSTSIDKAQRGSSRTSLFLKDSNVSSNKSSRHSLTFKTEKSAYNQKSNQASQTSSVKSSRLSVPSSIEITKSKDLPTLASQPVTQVPVSANSDQRCLESYQIHGDIKTPDFPTPEPPSGKTSLQKVDVLDDSFLLSRRTGGYPETNELYHIDSHKNTIGLSDEQALGAPRIKNSSRKPSNSSGTSSYRSALTNLSSNENSISITSNLTKASIIHLDGSRKKNIGTPHLMFSKKEVSSMVSNSSKVAFNGSFGATPKLESAKMLKESQYRDDASVREHQYEKNKRLLISQDDKFNNLQPKNKGDSDDPSNIETQSSSYSSHDYNENFEHHYNDQLLEKIHYYRTQPTSDGGTSNYKLAWILYLISFFIPPLFFFLGLGLLDEHLRGKISNQIKRLSLITGSIVLVLAFAMIGVGFGVGIKLAQP